MNQTAWIVGGGVLVIAFATLLYMTSSKPTDVTLDVNPVVESATTTQKESDPVIPTTKTTPVSATNTSATKTSSTNPLVAPSGDETVILHTSMGDITMKLYASAAPKAVGNFVKLAKSGFYDGVKFHRVIKDFMIQSGDPLSKDDSKVSAWGTGGPGYAFENEASGHQFVRGSLGMANSGGTNSNGSQFFIVTAPSTPFLNGGYTNFGEVTAGLDVAMQIQEVKTDGSAQSGTGNDRPIIPVIITSVEVK